MTFPYPQNPMPGRPFPDVIPQALRSVIDQKALLIEAERALMAELTGKWLEMEAAVNPAMENALADLLGRKRRVTVDTVLKSRKYKSMLRTADREMRQYMRYASARIADFQAFFGDLGLSDGLRTLQAGFAEYGKMLNFGGLDSSAFAKLVGKTGSGDDLIKLLTADRKLSLDALARSFLDNWRDPNALRTLQNAMAQGFNSTVATSRTELFRVYRSAVQAQYRASGEVKKYVRVSQHDSNTCSGCLMAEGDEYDIDEDFAAHVNCRCMLVPLIGQLRPDWPRGEDWFRQQTEAYQRQVLGPGRFQAWIEGRYSLDKLVKVQVDPNYGKAIVSRPLSELLN